MWLARLFQEADGKPSWGRLGSATTLGFALFWVTRLVDHNHALPDLGGLSLLIGTLYGLSAAKATVGALNGNGKGAIK